MVDVLIWLVKLPFVLVAVVLMLALVGWTLSLLGVALTPVLGVGLLILPFGLAFLLLARLISKLL